MFNTFGQMSKLNGCSMTLSIAAIIIFAIAPVIVSFDVLISYWPIAALILIFIIITILSLWFCPFEVKIDNQSLCLYFPIRKKEIPMKDIATAEVAEASKGLRPIFGQIGYFGWWGKYRYDGHKVFLYASNLDHLVCMTLQSGRKIVISCSDASELANRINRFVECNSPLHP